MARRKGTSTKIDPAAFDRAGAQVFDNPVKVEIEDSYLEYAYSVIHSRALPDARDGLKPVHRRILFSMNEQGYRPTHAYVKSSRVVGDCFVRGALVSTPEGLRPIEDIELGELVLDPAGRPVPVTAVYENPVSELVRVTWSNGHTMLVTPGQRFRTVADDLTTGWTEARDLTGCRTVAFGSGRHESDERGDDVYPYVLGLVAAEGFAVDRARSADGRVRIHMVDTEPLDVAHGWAISAGLNVTRGKREAKNPRHRDQHIVTFARHEGLLEAGTPLSALKSVPMSVLADRSAWMPFLAGFFDGDGYVRKRNREIVLVSTSSRMLRQVHSILADLGIHGHRWANPPTEGKDSLMGLSVSGRDAATLASLLRPWVRIGYKQDGLDDLRDISYSYGGKQGNDRLPWRAVAAEFTAAHLGGGWFKGRDGKSFRSSLSTVTGTSVRYGKDRHGNSLADRSFPLWRAEADGWSAKLARMGSPLAARLDTLSGLSFLEVESVEPVEPDTTFDIQVGSDEHAFVVEGFIIHNCMGKYHPHGDMAIYDAMVRMAQDFSLNTPLVDGHGNFGSPDDGPAASRYTEARMSQAAMLLVGELGEDTVDFRPNYDGSLQEPTVLPAAFPNLLVNGTSGIAVGMATNMIPHNLGEVVAAARWLVNHPDASLDKLMEFIPGPDLPTGGMLFGLDEVRKAYETGRGVVRMRAKVEIGPLEGSRGRQAITITELPYQVGSEKIIEKITDEVTKSKRLTGIADVKDLTDRENGTRLVVECKVGVNPQALLADLYRLTPMEQSFGINNLVLVDGQPQTLGLKALLEVFLRHRYEVVTRRTRYRRRKREERLHLVDGLLIALLNIDAVIKLIRGSDDASAAKTGLMNKFKLSDIQATYILDTPLRRLTRYDKLELESEQDKLRAEIAELSKILDDEAVLRKVVSTELAAVAKDLAEERRTALIDGDLKEVLAASKPAGPLEVTDDPCQVILSATGLVARTAAESEESSEARRRKGRVKHDAVAAVVHSTARGQVLLITNRGRAVKTDVLPLPVLPEQSGTVSLSGGMAASELVSLDKGERVIGIAPLDEGTSPGLAIGTRQGVVKVCSPEWPVRSDEFEVISLKDGDEIVGATWLTDGSESLVFVSSDSSLLRYAASLVRPQGLKGGGMAGINLAAGASAVFFGAVRTDDPEHGAPQLVTSTGQSVKVTPFDVYPPKGRATGGVRSHRFLKGETELALAWVGPRPAGSSLTGVAVELPEADARRDGSGHAHPGPDVVGHLVERD
ncbi:intein C-terminal splicing region [Actinokineospora alba]|uniref:DNA topoisomerase (ATP-hydrolyzing) n=1 Tax=Actinokineospora alba TaxID=504798 RepID=A0A1H0W7Q3_9PSEU|nr:DNA topoisomerase (ATP-hydrolyzing) [Actinokineospora alba]TDP69985.1 intein [Actinokineospora alba]SDJ50519.1 intein C-terminal splicing region [Actinokineospora alba]SDP86760.1 intein C-terminal splicing region [Actinokineospora alba]